MARLVISPLAETDLNEILNYIAQDKPEAALHGADGLSLAGRGRFA